MPVLTVSASKAYDGLPGPGPLASKASWRKSSYSAYNGNCVEVARLAPLHVGVRDSKERGRDQVLMFTRSEWAAFVTAVRAGRHDIG